VEYLVMKYRDLKTFLNSLDDNDERLDQDVTIYEANSNEFYGRTELMETYEDDVLPANHLYIAFE
tara:strand:+ start:443 stop:637 length:195 start_codon:yes stop_codon:yes gene_type:complete